MAFKIAITLAAKQDIDKTIEYYNQKAAGLGYKFYLHFKGAVDLIGNNPHYYSFYKRPYRRILVRKFPILVVHKIKDSEVIVLAVLPGMIDPSTISKRIE